MVGRQHSWLDHTRVRMPLGSTHLVGLALEVGMRHWRGYFLNLLWLHIQCQTWLIKSRFSLRMLPNKAAVLIYFIFSSDSDDKRIIRQILILRKLGLIDRVEGTVLVGSGDSVGLQLHAGELDAVL